ncbi:hypothetical protein BSPWISOXPB_9413 [uncultured Gammaproteobacteria bacterium]|nr:hypothetical protein BSPWISOXPB_9413 [uncultured Gammaproteobacteria bacterium]
MEEISANISEVIGLLVWSDWLTMITLIVFIGLGVKRGLVIGVVDLLFLIVAPLALGCSMKNSLIWQ